jgi:hypothetical protein
MIALDTFTAVDFNMLLTVAAIFAAYAIGLALGKQYERETFAGGYRAAEEIDPALEKFRVGLMAKVRTPLPQFGTSDPRDFAAALADPVRPKLSVVRS